MKYSKVFAYPLRLPNAYDLGAAFLIASVLAFFSHAAGQMDRPLVGSIEENTHFLLSSLPYYSLRTFFRIIMAMIASVIVTLLLGALLAKYRRTRPILLPIIDILQSLPPLGFTSFLAIFFISLHPQSTLGLEMAAITTIFISQVWNMILSFYKSLITIPKELHEACAIYRLSPFKKFWSVEVPFAIPSLMTNAMLSMSASWFFVVACEALIVSGKTLYLPGMGSFIYWAIENQNFTAIRWAIFTMFITIVIYDQLLFRPLLAWSSKFQADTDDENDEYQSWFFDFLSRTRLLSQLSETRFDFSFLYWPKLFKAVFALILLSSCLLLASTLLSLPAQVSSFSLALKSFYEFLTFSEITLVLSLGATTALKVLLMVFICTLIWVPIGIQIGIRPALARTLQPFIQLLAAFPPSLFYPFIGTLVVYYRLNVDLWTMLLMILGTQWYILFNVIDGARQISKEQRYAIENFHIKGYLKWKRFYLPAIMPSIITGAMTAAGGCWNVCPESDIVMWGNITLQAHGLGAYIHEASISGNFHKLTLGMITMAAYVLLINKVFWQRLLEKLETYY